MLNNIFDNYLLDVSRCVCVLFFFFFFKMLCLRVIPVSVYVSILAACVYGVSKQIFFFFKFGHGRDKVAT